MGGGYNAVEIGVTMGFPKDCCLTFTNNDEGFKNALHSLSCSISRHRSNENHAFTGLERVNSVRPIPIHNLVRVGGLQRV